MGKTRVARSSKQIIVAIAAAVLAAGVSSPIAADTLTFDDLTPTAPGGTAIPASYGGLNWSNFYFLNATTDTTYGLFNGYRQGRVSGDNVAFNGSATTASLTGGGAFDFQSASLTAAWNDGLTVTVQAYLGNTLKYTKTLTIDSTAPTLVNFNFAAIDRLTFDSAGGTPHGYGFIGDQFALDNFTFGVSQTSVPTDPTGVPLPTIASTGIALLGGAAVLRRRRR